MHAITCHFLVALTESQDFEDQILTLWMLVQNFQFLIILCCAFSSASVLLLFGVNDKLQKETNAALLKYIPLSHSLVFFVINLPLAIFNSDFSECREVLLCICVFCVCMQTGSLQFEMFSGILSQTLRKAASFGACDVFNQESHKNRHKFWDKAS